MALPKRIQLALDNEQLRNALRKHHERECNTGPVKLPINGKEWVEVNMTHEYADSTLYEDTVRLINGEPVPVITFRQKMFVIVALFTFMTIKFASWLIQTYLW